jgi:hypothetical protein
MLNKILFNIGLYEYFNDENYILMEIKNNLKSTQTLKKKFYCPTKLEILNKYHKIQIKKRPCINISELLLTKQNLKTI